jgi:hypothetical protein
MLWWGVIRYNLNHNTVEDRGKCMACGYIFPNYKHYMVICDNCFDVWSNNRLSKGRDHFFRNFRRIPTIEEYKRYRLLDSLRG